MKIIISLPTRQESRSPQRGPQGLQSLDFEPGSCTRYSGPAEVAGASLTGKDFCKEKGNLPWQPQQNSPGFLPCLVLGVCLNEPWLTYWSLMPTTSYKP